MKRKEQLALEQLEQLTKRLDVYLIDIWLSGFECAKEEMLKTIMIGKASDAIKRIKRLGDEDVEE